MSVAEISLLVILGLYVLTTVVLIIKHLLKKRSKAKAALRIVK